MAPTTVRRVAGRSPRQGTASTSGSWNSLGQHDGRRIRARFVLFRAQMDVGQRAVVVARRRNGLREQVLKGRAHLPDLAAVGFVKVERLRGGGSGLLLRRGRMLVVVVRRVHAAAGTGRVVALVLLERRRKTVGAVLVFRGEGITIGIVLRAGSVKLALLLVQCRGQTAHADVVFGARFRRRRVQHIHIVLLVLLLIDVIYATFPVATVTATPQRLTPAVVVVVMVHVVRRGHVVMVMVVVPVAVVLRVRFRRTAGQPILTRSPNLG
uniref:(northern house mosquito) hypothetical protein n=1 Tax=Culex pipiens TaxID=7175 RepID=A0A8D8KCA2_CULPI